MPWRRRRRPVRRPWEKNWRNPDMLVLRTYFTMMGNKVTTEMTPEESSDLSAEGVTADLPTFDRDPSYHWAKEARRKRS